MIDEIFLKGEFMKILVVGSINMDLTTYVDKLPLQGEQNLEILLFNAQVAKVLIKLLPLV